MKNLKKHINTSSYKLYRSFRWYFIKVLRYLRNRLNTSFNGEITPTKLGFGFIPTVFLCMYRFRRRNYIAYDNANTGFRQCIARGKYDIVSITERYEITSVFSTVVWIVKHSMTNCKRSFYTALRMLVLSYAFIHIITLKFYYLRFYFILRWILFHDKL